MNLLDRIIDYVAPVSGAKRRMARAAAGVFDEYEGSSKARTLDDWTASNASPDALLAAGKRQVLVGRSRQLERDDGVVRSSVNAVSRHTVGRGISPRPTIDADRLGITNGQAEEFTDLIRERWLRFVLEAPADEVGDFYEQQAMVDRREFVDGDVLTRRVSVRRPGRMFQTASEVIVCDRIITPQRENTNPNVRDGVIRGRGGQAVAYYVAQQHPGDSGQFASNGRLTFRRVPVWDGKGIKIASHMASRIQPGQTRGEPRLAPVLTLLRHFSKYMEAELVAKRLESCIVGFIERQVGQLGGGMAALGDVQKSRELEFEPGVFKTLPPGEKANISTPQRPGTGFTDYTHLVLRQFGAAIEMPLEVVLLDWSQSNYSNARAAILEFVRAIECRQARLVRGHSHPLYVAWIEEQWLRGMLPSFVKDFYGQIDHWTKAHWSPHGRRWVDPKAEGISAKLALENRLTNVIIENDELGRDWRDVERGRIEAELFAEELEEKMRAERGMTIPATPEDAESTAAPSKPKSTASAESDDDRALSPTERMKLVQMGYLGVDGQRILTRAEMRQALRDVGWELDEAGDVAEPSSEQDAATEAVSTATDTETSDSKEEPATEPEQ